MSHPPKVIIATFPDGAFSVVKGKAVLDRIIRANESELCEIQYVPVGTWAQAEALYRQHDGAN